MSPLRIARQVVLDRLGGGSHVVLCGTRGENRSWEFAAAVAQGDRVYVCRFELELRGFLTGYGVKEFLGSEKIVCASGNLFEGLALEREETIIRSIPSSWMFRRGENVLWVGRPTGTQCWKWHFGEQANQTIQHLTYFKHRFVDSVEILLKDPAYFRSEENRQGPPVRLLPQRQ